MKKITTIEKQALKKAKNSNKHSVIANGIEYGWSDEAIEKSKNDTNEYAKNLVLSEWDKETEIIDLYQLKNK